MENYILKKPINFEGDEIKEICMDLDGLSVRDLTRCEREAKMRAEKTENMIMPEFNKKYLACIAAKSAGVPTELVLALGAQDYTQVTMKVQSFLLGGDSEDEDEESSTSPAVELTNKEELSGEYKY